MTFKASCAPRLQSRPLTETGPGFSLTPHADIAVQSEGRAVIKSSRSGLLGTSACSFNFTAALLSKNTMLYFKLNSSPQRAGLTDDGFSHELLNPKERRQNHVAVKTLGSPVVNRLMKNRSIHF